jgi:TRAP transporter TAXI family solute receptor
MFAVRCGLTLLLALGAAQGVVGQPTADQLRATTDQLRGGAAPATRLQQIVVEARRPNETSQVWTERTNQGTVGVVTGGVDGTYIRIGADLQDVLDNGDSLRILPILGRGSVQNVADMLFLRGVDVAIVHSDILAYAKLKHLYPGIDQSVQYITKLYNEEVHILARPDIAALTDLQGQPVNIDKIGSGTAMTAMLMFDTLGIDPNWRTDDQRAALEKLRNGEIAAMVYVVGQPAKLFTELPRDTHLHFLPVSLTQALANVYEQGVITAADYPNLMEGGPVATLSVGSVMAVYGWPQGSERFKKVARFVDAFFDNFGQFQKPPRHRKWLEVDMFAEVPGWKRFPEAVHWLQRHVEVSLTDFNAFLATIPDMSVDAKRRLLVLYKDWQAHGGTIGEPRPSITVQAKRPAGG